MWHLIFPPLIIIVSIALLVRYLSSKVADPKISEKVSVALGGVESGAMARSLSRTEFFLKLSDRLVSTFKVLSLRIHNFFQHSSERLREKRKKIQEMKRVAENVSSSAQERLVSISRPSFSSWWKSKRLESAESEVVTKSEVSPVFLEELAKPGSEKKPFASAAVSPILPVRERPQRKRQEKWKEDECIRRIAENPKDIAAYETLGDYYFSIENMEDAKDCYRQALKLQPTNRIVKIKIRKLEKFFEEKEG